MIAKPNNCLKVFSQGFRMSYLKILKSFSHLFKQHEATNFDFKIILLECAFESIFVIIKEI
jgi:hypothetical protein